MFNHTGINWSLTKVKPIRYHFVNKELKEIKIFIIHKVDLNSYFCANFKIK
jgi:hypothetical protein